MINPSILRMIYPLLILSSALFAVGLATWPVNTDASTTSDYSFWIRNLSQDADPDHLYDHTQVKMTSAGKYVHVVWFASKSDFSGEEIILYRRSEDRGATFAAPVVLAHKVAGESSIQMPNEWNNLVASGPYVHVFFTRGWPMRLVYRRSADYGATFEAPQVFAEGYIGVDGIYAAASGSNVFVAWTMNSTHQVNLYCSQSGNGGRTFQHRLVARDDDTDGSMPYGYGVEDLASSGSNVYILQSVQMENWFSTEQHLYLRSSVDGCRTFKPARRVNVATADGGYYAPSLQNGHYSPNLAVEGDSVNVVWVNVDDPGSFDGWEALTLRTRTSVDAGSTLRSPKTLYTYPPGYGSTNGAQKGLETIARTAGNVYVATTITAPDHATYLWRSTDGGNTWSEKSLIGAGGWWPMLGIDPLAPGILYLDDGSLFKSSNGGLVFDGGFSPNLDFGGGYKSPRLVVDNAGVRHLAGSSNPRGVYMQNEIFYRRLTPPANPAAENFSLRLTGVAGQPYTPDHLQVPSTDKLRFRRAMTLEFWMKRQSDDLGFYKDHLVTKTRLGSEGSYEIGLWDGFHPYARLATSESANPYFGDWLGTQTTLKKGVWTHLAMTYNDALTTNNWRLYLNGILRAQATLHGTILTDGGRLLIGLPTISAINSGMLEVDEVRLWSVARSATQIRQAMAQHLTGQEAGLAVYFNFDKTFKDVTDGGNDAFPKWKERLVTDVPF